MFIRGLVYETIILDRAYKCTHKWVPSPVEKPIPVELEEYCELCGIFATEQGKKNLEAESRRRGFRP